MKDIHYAYCVARLRANEKYMLSQAQLLKLCEAESYEQAEEELFSLGWIKEKAQISDYVRVQNEMLWELLTACVPDKKALDVLCVLNDFFNIKAAVKCHFTGIEPSDLYVYPTTLNTKELTKKIESHRFKEIGGVKGESAVRAYEAAVKTENGQLAEIIIDRAAIDCLGAYGSDKDNSLVGEICGFLCDSANIKIAMRINAVKRNSDFAQEAIGECCRLSRKELVRLSCGNEEELFAFLSKTPYAHGAELFRKGSTYFDKWCDDTVIRLASKAKYTAFGFDPVCAYYYAKLNEIKSVRIILSAKLSNQQAESIKERVRALYV